MVTMLIPIEKESVRGQIFWQLQNVQELVERTVRLRTDAGLAPPGATRTGNRPARENLH
jgi:hypothetical protein